MELAKDSMRSDKGLVAVVLAAGEGTRMKSRVAKVLHRLAGKPLLQHVCNAARAAGAGRMLIVGHGKLRGAFSVEGSLKYVVQKDRLGTGHALRQASSSLKNFRGDMLVLCGDAPLVRPETLRDLLASHRSQGNVATVLTAHLEDPFTYGRIVRDHAGRVVGIVEENAATQQEKVIGEVNSGIYALRSPQAWEGVAKIQRGPKGEYPLTDIIGILAAQGGKVGSHVAGDSREILGINSRAALARAERVLQERIAEYHMANGVTIVDPRNTYIGGDVRIGQDSVIEPFSVLEGDVRIGKDCVVGPFAHLRDGAVMHDKGEVGNFVEVKKSTIGCGAKAKHLSYLGDATVGPRANIGAGTITANYDGKHKHPTAIGKEAHIGSNTTLVAPVHVGARAVTGAGSVILSGKDVPAGRVAVGVPARIVSNGKRKVRRSARKSR